MKPENIADHHRSQKRFAILLIAIGCGLACGLSFAIIWISNYYAQSNPTIPGFPKNDQLTVNSCTFFGTAPSYTAINMSIKNTGSSLWTLSSIAQVNSLTNVVVKSCRNNGNLNCTQGKTINIYLTTPCTSGNHYSITLLLTDGNKITYVATAP